MQPALPRGFRDVLFDEGREREAVASSVTSFFAAWGYEPVETPAIEEYRTLEAGVGADLDQTAFRLFDLDGSLLALRPEMTVPIARVVASRLGSAAGVHRIRYAADVFREHASLRGQARQFRQIGIELIGAHGALADVEVVLLLAGALEAAGLASFTVGIGSAEVFRALVAKAGGPEEWTHAAEAAAQGRNLVELDRLADRDDLPNELASALRTIPRLRGGREALERCRALANACGCGEALATIAESWDLLEDLGLTANLQLDFGIMRSFAYYTGLQLEAFAPGLGLPLAGGGRYDKLLSTYGHPAPAAGFALGLERVMIALAEQERTPVLEPLDAVLGGDLPADVFRAGAALRAAGWRVALAPGLTGVGLVRDADARGALEALSARDGAILRLDRAGEPATAVGTPVPAPPRETWAARRGQS